MAVPAVAFDVFGTLVDWRSGVADAFRASGVSGDPYELADAWRARYRPILAEVNDGARPWGSFDDLHLVTLDDLLSERGARLSGEARRALVGAWHRLDPWPDVRPGLEALRGERPVGMPSNGHVALPVRPPPSAAARPAPATAAWTPSSRPSWPRPTSRRPRPTAPRRGCSACDPPSSCS